MKVLHVIPSMSRVHGGPTHALEMMERALARQGVTVETATTDDDGPGRRTVQAHGERMSVNGVARWYFPKRTDTYKASPAFARWIAAHARDYDLLHIHALFSFTSTAAAWAARRAGVPYVVRPLGTLARYGVTRRRPWAKGLSLRFVEGPMLRGAAAVHFTSVDEAVEARALGLPLRERVIPLGVATQDAPSARLARPPSACNLLFLSRLDPKKNLESLLDAVALFAPEFPDVRLVVGGDGPAAYREALKAHAARLGLSGRVTWAGHLEGDVKAAALDSADIFVLPSFSENFGIAAAEAMAAGLPCVLGHGVALAKDVTDARAGMAIEPDAVSVAAALRFMMADPLALRAMGERAKALAQNRWSSDAMGRDLKQLYEDILAR